MQITITKGDYRLAVINRSVPRRGSSMFDHCNNEFRADSFVAIRRIINGYEYVIFSHAGIDLANDIARVLMSVRSDEGIVTALKVMLD